MEKVSLYMPGVERWMIRRYEPGDLPGVRALHDRTPPSGTIASELPRRWPEDLDRIPELFHAFWVVTTEMAEPPEIIGMVGVKAVDAEVPGHVFPDDLDRARAIRLLRMRIAPEWQRRGIGSRLVKTVVDWARASGYRAVILETTVQQEPAVALYRRQGFQEIGRSQLGPYTLVWMRRELD